MIIDGGSLRMTYRVGFIHTAGVYIGKISQREFGPCRNIPPRVIVFFLLSILSIRERRKMFCFSFQTKIKSEESRRVEKQIPTEYPAGSIFSLSLVFHFLSFFLIRKEFFRYIYICCCLYFVSSFHLIGDEDQKARLSKI